MRLQMQRNMLHDSLIYSGRQHQAAVAGAISSRSKNAKSFLDGSSTAVQ